MNELVAASYIFR